MEHNNKRRRVFLSHTSVDKPFVRALAISLKVRRNDIWLDEAEIAPGDSIITKVFEGLSASDTVVVVLSKAAVRSRWVAEELTSAATRRLVDQDVLLVPALIEDCDIPDPIKHLCYADFRNDFEYGLSRVLDAIAPLHREWATLGHLADHFETVSNRLPNASNEERVTILLKLHDILESALNIRTEIEDRSQRRAVMERSFFDKIEHLADSGIDVRSQTWNSLVELRALVAHDMRSIESQFKLCLDRFKLEPSDDGAAKSAVRLNEIMNRLSTPRTEVTLE